MFGFHRIKVEEINRQVADGSAYLVDVRNDHEWEGLHAKGAMHLPLDQIASGAVPTNDKNIKLYLYCASGNRSSMAATTLQAKGYSAENIGGLNAWQRAGGATESGR